MDIYDQIEAALKGPRGTKVEITCDKKTPETAPVDSGAATLAELIGRALSKAKETKTPAFHCKCPSCNTDLSAVGGSGGSPKDKDFSLCTACGEILVFDSELTLKLPSVADWQRLGTRPDAEKAIFEMQATIRKNR